MGRTVNPSNEGFARILATRYVDKTGLITEFDSTVATTESLVLSTRPRRFGKTFSAHMLVAFYSCGCDSRALFEGLEVSRHNGWDAHLNAYNVIFLDMAEAVGEAREMAWASTGLGETSGTSLPPWSSLVVPTITRRILQELRRIVPDAGTRASNAGTALTSAILDVVDATGRKFVFVIDEWDALYRLAGGDAGSQEAYMDWLGSLFKDITFTPVAVAGAYMTGILPARKDGHGFAVSSFNESTMLDPGPYAPYIGFTEAEVLELSQEEGLDPDEMHRLYDGYTLRYVARDEDGRGRPIAVEAYSPYSVMQAADLGEAGYYWPLTDAFEGLRGFVSLGLDGLQERILRALSGEGVPVDPLGFGNDMFTLDSADDMLTLLVHLGYLAYDEGPYDTGTVRVPNGEVGLALHRAVTRSRHPLLRQRALESAKLLEDIVACRAENVAAGIATVHDRDCNPLFYNEEQALRAVVKTALASAVDPYLRIEEMPGGRGRAGIVYIPKPASAMPALVVELKWDKPVESAIAQIKETGYCEPLEGISVPVLLVGITYSTKTKEHVCAIEEWVR